jgi:hypothetical protein
MGRNTIQVQKRLSVPEFLQLYGTEVQREEVLAKIRWPNGFRCPRCEGSLHGLVDGRRLKRDQCRQGGYPATVTAGTTMEATKLPLIIWLLAFYLIGQAKTSISFMAAQSPTGYCI